MTLLLIGLYGCITLCWGMFVLAAVYGESSMPVWWYMSIPFIIALWPVLAVLGAVFILFMQFDRFVKGKKKCKQL